MKEEIEKEEISHKASKLKIVEGGAGLVALATQ